jgi:16S rRNA (adenine1518-N6/adenine1519-N6)-dimethyltransferase
MTLTQIRQLLAQRGIQLTKSLGQNFLHDGNQLRRIVEAAELRAGDRVLEIGPGLGPLTELLLATADTVLAIEMDARLVGVLRERFAPFLAGTNHRPSVAANWPPAPPLPSPEPAPTPSVTDRKALLQLIHDDALAFLRREPRDWTGWKLVANLPYSVASTVLVELAQAPQPPERMVVTLQLEVAQRLTAPTDGDDYGILTLLVQLAYEPAGLFRIPPECFFPMPEVVSACVTLRRRERPLLPPEATRPFSRLVKLAFSQRRKMMLKLLRQSCPRERLEEIFKALDLDPQIRAEKVSLEQFVQLTTRLGPPGSLGAAPAAGPRPGS